MTHAIRMRWLINLHQGQSHFPHDFWNSYEYLVHRQSEISHTR